MLFVNRRIARRHNNTVWLSLLLILLGSVIVAFVVAKEDDVKLMADDNECLMRIYHAMGVIPKQQGGVSDDDDPFSDIEFHVHRNGEGKQCGTIRSNTNNNNHYHSMNFVKAIHNAVIEMSLYNDKLCPTDFENDKYFVESLITKTLYNLLLPENSCMSIETDKAQDADKQQVEGFLGYCDMGESKTPILLDHNDLFPIIQDDTKQSYLPCHFHTREGVRITSLRLLTVFALQAEQKQQQQQQQQQENQCQQGNDADPDNPSQKSCALLDTTAAAVFQIYAVPAGRVFMFAPTYVGEKFYLDHVSGGDPYYPVYLDVISVNPRVFDIHNFFTKAESNELVARALKETRDAYKIKRSTTGASEHAVYERRTSESGFDTHGKVAVQIKKRCFRTLGFDEYLEGHGDGLQILRYNTTKAYVAHMDYIDDPQKIQTHNFDSSGIGGNRFATILLYMSDLGPLDGGETVFVHGTPPPNDRDDNNNNNNATTTFETTNEGRTPKRSDMRNAIKKFQKSDQGYILERGSWEEEMVAECRTKLSIRSNSARAVLFYSQHPNGQPDHMSLHGGCPVLSGEKWAANLWVWNTPRQGYPGAPVN